MACGLRCPGSLVAKEFGMRQYRIQGEEWEGRRVCKVL